MAIKATERTIQALEPKEKPYERVLEGHRGLIVRVYPSGEKSFMYRWKQDGILKRVILPAGTLADAQSAYHQHKAAVRRGEDPLILVRQQKQEKRLQRLTDYHSLTFGQLVQDYIGQYAKIHKKTWQEDARLLANDALPAWHHLPAHQILRRDIIALLDTVAKRAPIRANRLLSCLRKLFNWALSRDLLATSPCLGVTPPSKENTRDRVLSDSEIGAFWQRLPHTDLNLLEQYALKLQLVTGARVGEVCGAKWDEFDLVKSTWLIPASRAKNGRECLIPLSSLARDVIAPLPRGSQHLFPIRRGTTGHLVTTTLMKGLARNLPVFGIHEPFKTHDLRRTVATKLAELGISRTVIDACLNHAVAGIIRVYDRHDYFAEKKDALERWAQRISELIQKP